VLPPCLSSATRHGLSVRCGWVAALVVACNAPPDHPTEPSLELRKFAGPPDVVLDVACTPTGLETCFDAIDNNCNGAIDEGCGVRTGIIQFSIAWPDATADVDLVVTDPSGDVARVRETTETGLVKDRDCPGEGDECQGQNTENVVLVHREVPRGTFRVLVRCNRLGEARPPLRVRVGARVGQRSYATELELEGVGAERLMTFEL
jgi:tRNA (guanosine-2'-O-)-methyltransferase